MLTGTVGRQVAVVPCILGSEAPRLFSQSSRITTEVFSYAQLRVVAGIKE